MENYQKGVRPMWSWSTNVRPTDGSTDGRQCHAIEIPRFALQCIAR